MLRLEIPTDAIAEVNNPGETLATMLRSVADRIESEVRLVPSGTAWWRDETYRHATRIDDVLVGAVYTIERD